MTTPRYRYEDSWLKAVAFPMITWLDSLGHEDEGDTPLLRLPSLCISIYRLPSQHC